MVGIHFTELTASGTIEENNLMNSILNIITQYIVKYINITKKKYEIESSQLKQI